MAEEVRTLKDEIDYHAFHLMQAIRRNERLPEDQRVTHSAAIVVENGDMVAVDVSPHKAMPLFVELLKQRPDLRGPMQRALDNSFRIADR